MVLVSLLRAPWLADGDPLRLMSARRAARDVVVIDETQSLAGGEDGAMRPRDGEGA